ncbi:MAG TPA: malto-oligosyltrehalose trehalohydrolase [Solirubrobacteraceae bacterium]|nr:malto-oligosyltrehalose trehalohydrolase [Solirubrobacteraceae bacterium]
MSGPYPFERRFGAFPIDAGRAQFRLWAPSRDAVVLRVGDREHALDDAGYGVLEATVEARPGEDYAYVAEGIEFPDPASRWQANGLRGRSRLLDTGAFAWSDEGFQTPSLRDTVLYELHVGTFTEEGTFDAAIGHLRGLRELGVTTIELMPVAAFPGRHGWGYDGVYISAAHDPYGGPEGLQRFVDAAHGEGLAVVLDVVYNHVGASGVQGLECFGPYFTTHYETPWGRAMNYDDTDSDPVREWVLQSAEQWIRDFHLDGLRLDAIHSILDSNPEHLVAAICRRVHAINPRAIVIAESGLNDPKVLTQWGCDAVWADDFHHALRVLLTGDRQGYYGEFGTLAALAKVLHRPHFHDGDYSTFRRRRFGAPADAVAPEHFVVFSSNHDQVGNRALGDRLPVEARPLAAFMTLLAPFTPMLFQGEEHGERAPFQFFSDHIDEEIAVATREGRRREFAAFAEFAGEEVPDPQDEATFRASKLTREGEPPGLRDLYAALLRARAALPGGEADSIDFDEHAGWLRVGRGPYTLLANFSQRDVHVPVEGTLETVLTTHHATLEPGFVVLPALSGALLT